jgi:hypothetical protein
MKKLAILLALLALLLVALVPSAIFAQNSVGDRYEKMAKDGLLNPYTGFATVAGRAAGLPARTSYEGVAQAYPWVTSIEDGTCWDMSFSIDTLGFVNMLTPEMKVYMGLK